MTTQNKLLISACLLGHPVRYDGKSKPLAELDWLLELQQQNRLYVICPESEGGLPTPRDKAEQKGERVITISGEDVTTEFKQGASLALQMCQSHNIGYALLKANSPSCGNQQIYNGEFSGLLVEGAGVTAGLLMENDISVFSELQLEQLKAFFADVVCN